VVVNDSIFSYPADKRVLGKYLRKLAGDAPRVNLFLNADYNVYYAQYNDLYAFLKNFDTLRMHLIPKEFWYNPKETVHD